MDSTGSELISQHRVEFDRLRSFAVTMVLLHHAILAYATFAFINVENPIATFSPVVDDDRFELFDLIVGYNDSFLMPLLFFVSGLFVWSSLQRKGPRVYLTGRLKRLGIPFLLGLPVLVPLAYYPARLEVDMITGSESTFGGFWLGMVRSGFGTAGPLWFLWLLLVFCIVAVGVLAPARTKASSPDGAPNRWLEQAVPLTVALFGLSTAVYLPLAAVFGSQTWTGIGPFTFQSSRILFYLVYFGIGIALGAFGLDRTALRRDGPLAKRWWAWLNIGVLTYFGLVAFIVLGIDQPLLTGLLFSLTSTMTVLGFAGLFLSRADKQSLLLSRMNRSSYGIYVVHYTVVTWIQLGLLPIAVAAGLKGVIAFVGTLVLSWALVASLLRIPAIAKVI